MSDFFDIGNATANKCQRTYKIGNETHLINIPNPYEGIPETLIINAVSWAVLLILFAILRRKAWNYGRMALVHRNEERILIHAPDNRYNVWTTLFYGTDESSEQMGASSVSLDANLKLTDKGFFSWIRTIFTIKDEDYLNKCGRDAVQYLSFQRYLLVYLLCITVLSIAVVLPVNFQGVEEGDKESFGHTTISNLAAESSLLWLHALFALLYLALLLLLVAHFSRSLHFDRDDHVSRTLMISRIPMTLCFKNTLLQHFQEAYPDAEVTDIQFAHDIAKLLKIDAKLKLATEARIQSELEWSQRGVRPKMVPRTCGRSCACCCRSDEVDCIEYYSAEETSLREQLSAEKAIAFQKALGVAFVTFQTELMAAKVLADCQAGCHSSSGGNASSLAHDLKVFRWHARFSPAPENIYWGNLATTPVRWWIKAIAINLILIVLLIFFSTPTVIMNTLDQLFWERAKNKAHSSVVVHFLPTIVLWTFTALLPNIVYYTDQLIGHYTRSTEHHTVMRKSYVFLLLMVLVLPSLGLTSVMALFLSSTKTEGEQELRWSCIFLPDNGAFFVNYIITCALIGTALEIFRLPELITYAIRVMLSKSRAEEPGIRKRTVWEFQFGYAYAWMLCIFTVVTTYSLAVPLVTPFGLLYLALKHMVDRYNLYFAYKPSHISPGIHSSAVTYTVWAAIMLQLNILFFAVVRKTEVDALVIFTSAVLFVSMLSFIGWVFFGWFKHLPCFSSPYRYVTEESVTRQPSNQLFVASVLQSGDTGATSDPEPTPDYGTTSSTHSLNTDRDV